MRSTLLLPLLLCAVVTSALWLWAPSAGVASAQGPRAGLVVQFGPGDVREFCVNLGGSERTGEELLNMAGVDVTADVSALGALVCSINGTGCAFPSEPCLCRCQVLDDSCTYWTYFTIQNGKWVYESRGAASRVVHDGDVDGWSWGPGGEGKGITPPVRTFAELCRAAGPSAVPSPVVGPGGGNPGFATATAGASGRAMPGTAPSQSTPTASELATATAVGGTAMFGANSGAGSATGRGPAAQQTAAVVARTATIAALEAQLAVLGELATSVANATPDLAALATAAAPSAGNATPTLRPAERRDTGAVDGSGAVGSGGDGGNQGWNAGGLGTFVVAAVGLGVLWRLMRRRGE